jgi:hypothetical protein
MHESNIVEINTPLFSGETVPEFGNGVTSVTELFVSPKALDFTVVIEKKILDERFAYTRISINKYGERGSS